MLVYTHTCMHTDGIQKVYMHKSYMSCLLVDAPQVVGEMAWVHWPVPPASPGGAERTVRVFGAPGRSVFPIFDLEVTFLFPWALTLNEIVE